MTIRRGAQCLILAGGRATRLGSAAAGRPKHLVEVGGRPFADWQLSWLARSGVDQVVYAIGMGGEHIRTHVGDGRRWGLAVEYVDEGEDLRGTGGAVRGCLDAGVLRQWFIVLYGDSIVRLDLDHVVRHFRDSGAPALMTVFENDGRLDRSNASFDGRLVRYDKRRHSPDMRWIDYGLLVMSDGAAQRIPPNSVSDLGDLLHDLGEVGELVGYPVADRFYEIGRPESLAELDAALRTGALVL